MCSCNLPSIKCMVPVFTSRVINFDLTGLFQFLKILMEFLSSDGNYAMYRKALGDATGFLIPIL